jgi:hypothetical protein
MTKITESNLPKGFKENGMKGSGQMAGGTSWEEWRKGKIAVIFSYKSGSSEAESVVVKVGHDSTSDPVVSTIKTLDDLEKLDKKENGEA